MKAEGRAMPPAVRKAVLAVHLVASIGWIGAVAAYLVLDLTVATSEDPSTVRGAWIAMGAIVAVAIVPLALASLLTGVVMSLGTRWGLVRHWWVLISLALTVFAVVVLLLEVGVVTDAASLAASASTSESRVLALPPTLPHSVGGLLVLVLIHVLNVYKPQGLTPYGWRKLDERREASV